jgi:hypothetical protein
VALVEAEVAQAGPVVPVWSMVLVAVAEEAVALGPLETPVVALAAAAEAACGSMAVAELDRSALRHHLVEALALAGVAEPQEAEAPRSLAAAEAAGPLAVALPVELAALPSWSSSGRSKRMKTILSIAPLADDGYDVIFDEGHGPVACQVYDTHDLQHFSFLEVRTALADDQALLDKPLAVQPVDPSVEIAQHTAYLASTDWYVTRQAETGKAIPADVAAARALARVEISLQRGQL